MTNIKTLNVYTDASYHDYVASTACVAVFDDLIIEQNASAYSTSSNNVNTHELAGIENALKLAVKVVRRKKFKNISVVILCDNIHSINHASSSENVYTQLSYLRERGCNAMITYVDGNHPIHNICHLTAGKYRKRFNDARPSPVVVNAIKKASGKLNPIAAIKRKQATN